MSSNFEQVDQPTRFVGRETELSETKQLLKNADCRLLTLVGVGGVGKTRLAIQLAKVQQQTFVHGVWFVNMQPLQSGKQIVSVVMDAMGVVPSGHETPENQLLQYLQEKIILLLLDNFQHVLDGVGILAQIIQHAPEIKLLVPSREALSLPEEWLYPVEGLAFAEKRLPGVSLFQMDARRIPFESEFDVIGAFDLLEHIVEDDAVLS